MKDNNPMVCALPVFNRDGYFNVFRFDTKNTENILFNYKAVSSKEAEKAALSKIEEMKWQQK